MRAEIERLRNCSTGALAHESIIVAGKFDLAGLGKLRIEQRCDREAQDAVPEEFEPLIVSPALRRPGAGMGQRLAHQIGVFEPVAETGLKLFNMRFLRSHSADHVSDTGPSNFKRPA